jgi:RND family efflux transporter MFP subunit
MQRGANWKKWGGGAIGVIGLILLVLWMQGGVGGRRVYPGREIPPTIAASDLKTLPVRERTDSTVTAWPGTVAAKTKTLLSAQVAARVLEVKVQEGDRVKKGAVLVLLDRQEIEARLKQAEAEWSGATARRTQTEADYQRMKLLIEEEVVTRQQMEASEAAYQTAQAQEEAARRQVDAAKILLDFTAVTAPFDGQVVRKEIDPGEFAVPGRPLVALEATDRFRLEASVPVAEGDRLRRGEAREVEITGLPPMQGVVDEIVPAADPATRTVVVKLLLPSGMPIRSGMFGRLILPGSEAKGIFIPKRVVREIGQLETVRVLEGGKVVTRHIQTGREIGEEVEVLSGLLPDDQIVLGEGSS